MSLDQHDLLLGGEKSSLKPVIKPKQTTNVMSIDLEDWFHMMGVPSLENPETWDSMASLVEPYTKIILEILSTQNVKGTFFVLGWIAQKYPTLVREIAKEGHEIACHSDVHSRIDRMSPATFTEDLRRATRSIQDAYGGPVLGFRAPSFSITPGAEWAMEIMLEEGIRYDASLFPVKRDHGGYSCQRSPFLFPLQGNRFIPEIPMTVMKLLGIEVPFSGGGYMRLLPMRLIREGYRQINRNGQPVVLYIHPRDFAYDCPRVAMKPLKYFKSYVGLKSLSQKFVALVEEYPFTTCLDYLDKRGLLEVQTGS